MKSSRFSNVKLIALLCLVPIALAACGGGDDTPAPSASAAKSVITAAPATVSANGKASAAIAVKLKDGKGNPYTGSANVAIKADPCTRCVLSYTNSGGQITGTLKSTAAEDIVLSFTVNGTVSPSTATVHFVAGPPAAAQSRIGLSAAGGPAAADGYTAKLVTVTLYDRFGNPVRHGGYAVNIFRTGASAAAVGPIADNGDGSYRARVTSVVAGTQSVGFSIGTSISPNIADATFQSPPPPASAPVPGSLMQAWTVRTCTPVEICTDHGIYEASATDPSAPTTHAVPGDLMPAAGLTPYPGGDAFVAIERASYDPKTGTLRDLGAGAVVYAQGGKLYRLDLTHGVTAPTRLSTLSFTALCHIYGLSPYDTVVGGTGVVGAPALLVVVGFDGPDKTPGYCRQAMPKLWVVFSDDNGKSAPIPLAPADFHAGGDTRCAVLDSKLNICLMRSLVNPNNGAALGWLVQNGSDLILYSPNLVGAKMLAKGLVPAGSFAYPLSPSGIDAATVIDVPAASTDARSDTLYRVDGSGVTRLATLTTSANSPYFTHCLGIAYYPGPQRL